MINQLSANGGGRILFPPGNYSITSLTLAQSVTLQGTVAGPYDIGAAPPTLYTAMILCNGSLAQNAIVKTSQHPAAIVNLTFFYPSQNLTSVSGARAYAPTIKVGNNANDGGTTLIYGCTFINSYDAIILNGSRNRVENCNIGGLHNCITFNDCGDYTICNDIWMVPWHDYINVSFPSNMDYWCSTNKKCVIVKRVDCLMARNWGCQGWFYAGVSFEDNPASTPKSGWGWIDGLDIDDTGYVGNPANGSWGVVYGILASSTNSTFLAGGFQISKAKIGTGTSTGQAGGVAQTAIYFQTGGADRPWITLTNSNIRDTYPFGVWNEGTTNYTFIVSKVWNIDIPLAALNTPQTPASGVAVENGNPFPIQVFINTGSATITNVSINGLATGGNRGALVVPSRATVSITYTGGPPTWTWFMLG